MRISLGTSSGFWHAWRLTTMTSSDVEIRARLEEGHQKVREADPFASLWLVAVNAVATRRLAVMRALFTIEHAPELVDRPLSESRGFTSARGLFSGYGVGVDKLMATFCSWLAPGLVGVSAERLVSAIITIFEGVCDGIVGATRPICSSCLLRPRLSSRGELTTRSRRSPPPMSSRLQSGRSAQCNQVVFRLTDHARYRAGALYNPAAHLATTLSLIVCCPVPCRSF